MNKKITNNKQLKTTATTGLQLPVCGRVKLVYEHSTPPPLNRDDGTTAHQ